MMTDTSPRIPARNRAKRCYELAARGQMKAPDWLLVHGTVTVSLSEDRVADGIPHAWLESHGIVYDAVKDKFFPRKEYRDLYNARAVRRFTAARAAREILKHGVYGPFD